jgi:hypothetical protein
LIVLAAFALDHDRTGVFADERPVEIPPRRILLMMLGLDPARRSWPSPSAAGRR